MTFHPPRVIPAEEERDLGFGSVVANERRYRLLNKDGTFNVARDGLGLADRPKIGPRPRDVSQCEDLVTNEPDRFDIAVFKLGPDRLGERARVSIGDEREPELVTGLEEQSVEQSAMLAALVEPKEELVDRRHRPVGAEGESNEACDR